VLLPSRQFSNTFGTVKRKAILVLSEGLNFSGFVVMRPRSAGFRAYCKRLRKLKLTVSYFNILLSRKYPAQIRYQANFLHINIYLTQKIGEDMLWNIAVNDAGSDYDPLTLLRTRTMFGRPDWKSIYRRIREAIEIGQYLPGSSAQLKTKVGVSLVISVLFLIILMVALADLLLWSGCSRKIYQGSNSHAQ
jgi:hypothetical protein